jgi:predicted nuclease of predicted toxin-antitoxin system
VSKRVLLDEGVPRQLAVALEVAGLAVMPYPNSWKQISNGELLNRAEAEGFDVLVTNDKNITSQQTLRNRRIAIVVLPTNRRRQVLALAPQVIRTIQKIRPGRYLVVEPDSVRKR